MDERSFGDGEKFGPPERAGAPPHLEELDEVV